MNLSSHEMTETLNIRRIQSLVTWLASRSPTLGFLIFYSMPCYLLLWFRRLYFDIISSVSFIWSCSSPGLIMPEFRRLIQVRGSKKSFLQHSKLCSKHFGKNIEPNFKPRFQEVQPCRALLFHFLLHSSTYIPNRGNSIGRQFWNLGQWGLV